MVSVGSTAGRRHAHCTIRIGGRDVTHKFEPFLISVTTVDKKQGSADECTIELDDTEGVVQIPEGGTPVTIHMGWSGEGPRIPLFRTAGSPIYDVEPTADQLRI